MDPHYVLCEDMAEIVQYNQIINAFQFLCEVEYAG